MEEGRAGLAACVTLSENWSLIRERISVTVQALYRCLEGAWQRIQQLGEAKGRVVRFVFLYSGWLLCMQDTSRLGGICVMTQTFANSLWSQSSKPSVLCYMTAHHLGLCNMEGGAS